MKKVIALLLAGVMLFCFTACNSGDETPTTEPKTTSAPAQTKTTKPQETTVPATTEFPGESVKTAHWSLCYDPEVWFLESEYAFYESEYMSSLNLIIPDPEDEYDPTVFFYVEAKETDHHNFRDNLRENGFDQHAYAVDNAYETVNIGGLEFLVNESDEYVFYFMRAVSAGIDVEITISGDVANEAVTELLETLTFTIGDGENVDAPWYWEGTPYAVAPGEETVGAYTLESVQIPFADAIVTYETFDHNIAVVDNLVYVINDGAIQIYYYDGSGLTFALDMNLEQAYTIADASEKTVWFSSFMENLLCYNGQEFPAAFSGTDYVSMCPSAPWGVSWFSDSKILKLDFDGANVTALEYTLPEVDMISHLCIDARGNIFVCGSSVSDGKHRVFVYNDKMELRAVLDSEDKTGLGSAVFATQTDNGFLALDGNMREVVLYGEDGSYIGFCDFSDLFGTDYPWPCDACAAEDGSILVIMTDERPDESADELIVFKLTGF